MERQSFLTGFYKNLNTMITEHLSSSELHSENAPYKYNTIIIDKGVCL